jgi:hypothetical protein
MNKVIAYAIIIALLVGGLVKLHSHGDDQGYSRALLEYSQIVNDALQAAAIELQKTQTKVSTITDKNNEARINEQIKSSKLESTIKTLRNKKPVCADGNDTPDFAPYILFNEAASSEDLPKSNHIQKPDAEADGLDAIQYSVSEYNGAASQVNALTAILGTLECVSVSD